MSVSWQNVYCDTVLCLAAFSWLESRLCRPIESCVTLHEKSHLAFDISIPFRLHRLANSNNNNVRTIFTCGFFQSWKYGAVELRRRLLWKPEVVESVRRFLDDVISQLPSTDSGDADRMPSRWKTVGIHVRCGDIAERWASAFGYTIPGRDYFRQAIAYVTDVVNASSPSARRLFVVTSDDIAWTKRQLGLEQLVADVDAGSRLVYSERPHDEGFDMALLGSCDAIILTTGTFGWWSAWLGRGSTVVHYARWPRPGSPLERIFRRRDFFPPDWIAIDSEPMLEQ